jgi:hypothetical protein
MEIGELYQFVLLIVLVGMILGVGILVIDQFSTSSGVTGAAQLALNNTRSAMTPIASTWLPLIVTVSVLSIILTLVIRSFSGTRR